MITPEVRRQLKRKKEQLRLKELRHKLMIAQRALCYLCGMHMTEKTASVDHLIPRSKRLPGGGLIAPILLAHKSCNSLRGNRELYTIIVLKE